jgi:hypothetical protein
MHSSTLNNGFCSPSSNTNDYLVSISSTHVDEHTKIYQRRTRQWVLIIKFYSGNLQSVQSVNTRFEAICDTKLLLACSGNLGFLARHDTDGPAAVQCGTRRHSKTIFFLNHKRYNTSNLRGCGSCIARVIFRMVC